MEPASAVPCFYTPLWEFSTVSPVEHLTHLHLCIWLLVPTIHGEMFDSSDCKLCQPNDGGCFHPAEVSGHSREHGVEQPELVQESGRADHCGTADCTSSGVSITELATPV